MAPSHLFVGQRVPVMDNAKEAEISSRVAIEMYHWLQEVCTTKLLGHTMILGEPGVVVENDKYLLFHHKLKVHK